MFENLTRKISLTFNKLAGRTTLTEEMLDDALMEIKVALLEADVSLAVAKEIVAKVREKSIGQKIVEKTLPAETIAKLVLDELSLVLGGEKEAGRLSMKDAGGGSEVGRLSMKDAGGETPPRVVMLIGLQGTGKTTTAGKLALHYKNLNKKVLVASTDVYRPGAREQLEIIAKQIGVESLPIIEGESVNDIIKRIPKSDIAIIDTAGRLQIDEALMNELVEIKNALKPDEILLTSDAMAGQDSLAVARTFNERVGVTGLVMTRADGDARGGCVLSMLYETGAPVKWVGVGEKMTALEKFYPDRAANRILGMGDVVTLVEKAQSAVSEDDAKDMMKKIMSGDFDLNAMKWQIEKMKKMGPIGGLLKMIPGLGAMAENIKDKVNDKEVDKQLAILCSMTNKERERPEIILASRKERIAHGSGTTTRDVETLIKKFTQMKHRMKQLTTSLSPP
ncbi:MAG: signal recognition particle protein Srp54 [Rickettsiales bacterium]|jgi:signal recognition particle subunit SRP54|nr:signal recognition particle protein Srp54 [Rickettsiales bacterium]